MRSKISKRLIYDGTEGWIDDWFRKNHKKLGFANIREIPNGPGDYFALRDGKWFRIELERTTHQFLLHKPHIRKLVDIIICYSRACIPLLEVREKEVIEIQPLVDGQWLLTKECRDKVKEADEN